MSISHKRNGFNLFIAKFIFANYLIWNFFWFYLRRRITAIAISIIIIITVCFKLLLFPSYSPDEFNKITQKTVYIPRGSSLRDVAEIMTRNEIISNQNIFIILGRLSGYQNRIKAGLFKIPEEMHPWHLLKYLSNPRIADIKVTIPEGILSSDIAGLMRKQMKIDSTRFMELINDSLFCQSLGVPAKRLEGYLHPETYFFIYGMSEKEILEYLVNKTLECFEPDSVRFKIDLLNMDMNQIIILASIIEGEVVVDSERVLVSSVYHNRLKKGWPLQADPTIQYIIPGPPRRLLHRDLEIDSPFNTYLYRGLPPGPINNPGRESIHAAIFPARTQFMYFVATGDGGHRFSKTSEEHAYWKAKFDRVRRETRRNRKN